MLVYVTILHTAPLKTPTAISDIRWRPRTGLCARVLVLAVTAAFVAGCSGEDRTAYCDAALSHCVCDTTHCNDCALQYAVLPSLNSLPPSDSDHFEAATIPQTPRQVRYAFACLLSVENLAQLVGHIGCNNQIARKASRPPAYDSRLIGVITQMPNGIPTQVQPCTINSVQLSTLNPSPNLPTPPSPTLGDPSLSKSLLLRSIGNAMDWCHDSLQSLFCDHHFHSNQESNIQSARITSRPLVSHSHLIGVTTQMPNGIPTQVRPRTINSVQLSTLNPSPNCPTPPTPTLGGLSLRKSLLLTSTGKVMDWCHDSPQSLFCDHHFHSNQEINIQSARITSRPLVSNSHLIGVTAQMPYGITTSVQLRTFNLVLNNTFNMVPPKTFVMDAANMGKLIVLSKECRLSPFHEWLRFHLCILRSEELKLTGCPCVLAIVIIVVACLLNVRHKSNLKRRNEPPNSSKTNRDRSPARGIEMCGGGASDNIRAKPSSANQGRPSRGNVLGAPGEILMGITDEQARRKLAEVRRRIKSYAQLMDESNIEWAKKEMGALPKITIPSVQAVVAEEKTYQHDRAVRSLYAVRNYQGATLETDTLHREMKRVTSIHTTEDGNCHDRSTLTSLVGREEGHLGMRLRNTLKYIISHNELFGHGSHDDIITLRNLATPEAWLGATATALTALNLECPIAVLCPLGVERAEEFMQIFMPPTIQEGAQVIVKMWTGKQVQHPPAEALSRDYLIHFCTGLAADEPHLNTILSCMRTATFLTEQARERAAPAPCPIAAAQRIDIDAETTHAETQHAQTQAQTYAEVVRRGQNKKLNPGAANKQAAPKSQQKIEAWVTRTKAPQTSKNTQPKHNNQKTQGTQTKHTATVAQPNATDQAAKKQSDAAEQDAMPENGEDNTHTATQRETLPTLNKEKLETTRIKIVSGETEARQAEQEQAWPIFRTQQTAPPRQTKTANDNNPSRTRKQETEENRMWKLYLQNVRGLTADNTVAELAEIIQQNQPDVVMLTETQLRDMTRGRGAKIHSLILANKYIVYQSPASEETGGQGVMVAIHKQIASLVTVVDIHTPDKLRGIMKQVILNRKGWTPMAVTAVYIPCGLTKRELGDLYKEIKTNGLDKGQDIIQIMGGDWNAEPKGMKQDDKKHNTKDRALHAFTEGASLTIIPRHSAHEHKPTFRDTSFIDNLYVRTPANNCGDTLALTGDAKVIEIWGNDTTYTHTDHNALIAQIDLTEHGLQKPAQMQDLPPNKERRLVLPLTKEEEAALKNLTRAELSERILEIQMEAKAINEEILVPHETGTLSKQELDRNNAQHTERIDTLAGKITHLLQSMMEIAHKVGRTKSTTAITAHHRPRVTNRRRNKLVRCRKQLRYMKSRLQMRSTNNKQNATTNPTDKTPGTACQTELPEGHTAANRAIEEMCEEEITDDEILAYIDRISEMEASARRQIASIDRTHATLGSQRRTDQHNSILDTNQRLGNKLIMQPRDLNTIKGDLRAIKSTTGAVIIQ